MEAKEKAKELVYKFKYRLWEERGINITQEDAAHCALIAVDELIEEQRVEEYNNGTWHRLNYWVAVKEEIENL
jgi:hypothetical protein